MIQWITKALQGCDIPQSIQPSLNETTLTNEQQMLLPYAVTQ